MTALLRLIDETPGAAPVEVVTLKLASERVTVREVIRRRLEEEEKREISKRSFIPFRGKEKLEAKESVLNQTRPTDWKIDRELENICRAIEQQRVIVLFNDQQLSDPDAEVAVTGEEAMTFLQLVPLQGG